MVIFVTLSLIVCFNHVFGGILDCDNKYQSKHPETNAGASWCANEGEGKCTGPGKIYYGAALTWTYVELDYGEEISCSNSAFECDPLVLFKKQCWKEYNDEDWFVTVNFTEIRILKTNDDGSNGDGVEEWDIYQSDPGITMNVDFIDTAGTWDGCNFNMDHLYLWEEDENSDCKPPANTVNSNGFYECAIGGEPILAVSALTYVSGLKYTFNFQIGDFDGKNKLEFDDGPIFDFTYTESDHTSINELINNNGPIERYFTRWDTNKNRRARLYVEYRLIMLGMFDEEEVEEHINICS